MKYISLKKQGVGNLGKYVVKKYEEPGNRLQVGSKDGEFIDGPGLYCFTNYDDTTGKFEFLGSKTVIHGSITYDMKIAHNMTEDTTFFADELDSGGYELYAYTASTESVLHPTYMNRLFNYIYYYPEAYDYPLYFTDEVPGVEYNNVDKTVAYNNPLPKFDFQFGNYTFAQVGFTTELFETYGRMITEGKSANHAYNVFVNSEKPKYINYYYNSQEIQFYYQNSVYAKFYLNDGTIAVGQPGPK
jgi:hypothetical protein